MPLQTAQSTPSADKLWPDRNAFLETAFQYHDQLLTIANARLRNQDRAEDAVSEAILKAGARRHQLRDPARLPGWLSRIVINQCMDQLRRDRRECNIDYNDSRVRNPRTPLESDSRAEHNLERVNAIENVLDAMLEIRPATHRDALILFYYRKFSYEQIARHLSLPVGTVKSRLNRAREALNRELSARGIQSADLDLIQDLAQWPDILEQN
ncbi:MAG: RNA polymerase sigma factor [Leptospiraceae bacterium]|nr:RNA polymerase sigma factor [Leptospiraceae bacterium]MCB1320963.1 RNA polymerase sigma factor [Leptospiraceae bacterium]